MKNIWIYEGGGSNPKPLAIIDMSKYSENDSKATSAILYKKVNNVFTLEIDIPTNCGASQSITNTSDLVLYDTEDNLQEFHVTEVSDLHEYSVIRTVYAEQSICELIDDIIISGTEMPTTTNPADYLAYILSFTRWSVGTVDSGIYNSRWKEDLTGKNCLEALQMFMSKYNCEFIVRYESDSKNRITGRYIDIKKTIGNNYGKRFEDTKDINALKRNLDLDSIKTAIYPRIAKQSNDENGNSTVEYIDISTVEWSVAAGDPVNKPLGQTILVDPDADAMYKRLNSKNGKLQERIMYAEWSEQTAKDAEDLCSQAWRILRANSVLNPSYEVNASDLYKLSGNNSDYAHEKVSLGDTCIIIDRKITPELRATTRVVEIEEDLLNPINNKYVFGKYRQTLATSNVDQQKSIEEKLAELSGRIQGVTVPEVKPQYQSGKVYYEDIKQDIQNEFMSASGYVMAEDSNGFWVMDAPQGGTPTKALILKGGNLAIANYNTAISAWEVGTFINGTSVNADYINTGHIAADVIATHSITTDHLAVSAVQYIRTGMATNEDLQGVIDSVTAIQTDYVTSQELNNAIDNVTGGTLTVSQIKAIEDTQRQLKAEYQSLYSQASKIYASEYLPSGSLAKNDLATKISAYTTAYNTYNNQITSMIADNNISDEEYRTYKSNADAYATALKNLTDAMEVANDARLANVYAQAREGMVTTAQLEVNNEQVIASAKQGMVSTAEMTDAISIATKDLVNVEEMNTTISNATNNLVSTTELNSQIAPVKIEPIKQSYNAIKVEYSNNKKQADTLYTNTYLSGTAKTNLNSAISDYSNKFSALTTVYNDIVNKGTFTEAQASAWSTAVTNLNTSTTTLAQRMQEAQTYINTAVYNASKNYTDKAIPDALTGYAKTSYVDSAKADAIADAKKGMVSTSQLEVNNTEILMKTASMGQYNMLRNTDFRDGLNYWTTWGTDGTEPIRVVRETDASPAAAMSGERNIGIISADNASTGNKNLGFYQATKKCVVGVSYTVGYWINCTNCSCNVQIESLDSSDTKSVLANKSYTNINGGHDRATWKYDSITFTVPNGSATIRFVCSLTNATNAIHRVLMVKPMMTTGINPQAWTAHPDEIHVGVVSVTEERGIMVEHSDTDSYSTLDSNGLKIWEYGKSSPVASFGESNTAYIDTVSTKKLVCDTVIPTIDMDMPISLYFSSTGSGDYSGKDSSNCCAGFTGAMSELCRRKGIDSTYIHGGFNITGTGWLYFYGVGTYLDEDIKLQNIYTTAPIKIELPAEMVQTGTFDLANIYGQVTITGKRSGRDSNDGAIIKRNGGKDGISVKNCSCVTIEKLRFSNTAKNGSGVSIAVGSTVYVSICDFCQFFYGVKVNDYSTIFINYCRGTSGFSGMSVYNSFVVYNGSIPAGNSTNDIDHNIYMYDCSAKLKGTASDANTKPIGTLQTAVPVASKAVTSSFSALAYQSTRQYSVTDLYQASWGGDSGFGDYRGNIFFGNSLKNWLSKASGISAQIYLQRQSSKHGNTNAKIKIEGTDVGTLALGEGKWFTVPSSVITGLKGGSLVSIELNGTGNDYYCRFEKNVILKVTATKEI